MAHVYLAILGATEAQLVLDTPANVSSKLKMTSGFSSFEIVHKAPHAELSVANGVRDLLTIQRETGDTAIYGNLTGMVPFAHY